MKLESILDRIRDATIDRFKSQESVRSYDDFLGEFTRNPYPYLRSAPQYILEMFDYYGVRKASRVGGESPRFCVFDRDLGAGSAADSSAAAGAGEGGDRRDYLVGQERVQNEFYGYISGFAKKGRADKMVLFHGPNGSGKTSFVECLVHALEKYSQTAAGVLLRFSWIFSEADERIETIGFERTSEASSSDASSLAFLSEKEISARIPCEMNDPPLFLIPQAVRRELIHSAVDAWDGPVPHDFNYTYFLEGDLCPKCRRIYDALLMAQQGDWKRVVRHVRVERFYVSKRYRSGAVSIEPQGNVDASVRTIQSERNWNLPTILRNMNLHEAVGEIIDANHGVLEYSDFLKRPPETSKYLLTTCEKGTVNLPHFMAYLNLLILGTTNENQLSIFKRSPDFSSFKGRIELISFPYLLMISKEEELYRNHIEVFSRKRHVTPHTARMAATWAVLTRLRRPNPKSYEGPLAGVISRLSPMDKAVFYDTGEPAARFKESERKLLRNNISAIRQEYEDAEGEFEGLYGPEYEGRRGASAREMMTMLSLAANSRKFQCLTPMSVFEALEDLCKDTSLYDFLRLPVEDGYHDARKFIDDVRELYVKTATEEVYNSIGLIDESEYHRFFLEYFKHVKAQESQEKVFNRTTNSYEEPNIKLIESVEELVGIKESTKEFRSNLMTKIAAWSLDNPGREIDYHSLFPEILGALQNRFFNERKRMLTLIEEDILKFGTEDFDALPDEDRERVISVLDRMERRYAYCRHCAKDVIGFVLRHSPR